MKRRQFITKASFATAGIATSAGLLSACSSNESPARLRKIGFQIYTVRNQVKDHLDATLDQLAKVGYDYCEVYGLYGETVLGHPIKVVKEAFKNAGIDIRSSHIMTGFEAPETKGSMTNDWQMAVDAAAELGTENLVCAYLLEGERETVDDYKKLAELLNKSSEVAKKSGIQLGYHNHAFEFEQIDGQEPMSLLMAETDANLVKLELDIYWSTRAGQNNLELFDKYAGRINQWHIKDMQKQGEEMTEVGNGIIDWKSLFTQAKLAGMKNFYVEQDGNWAASDVKSLETSYQYLKSMRY